MAATRTVTATKTPVETHGLSPEQMIQMYRLMYQSRRIDDREIMLKRQQKIFFQISGAGHEALSVAAGMALRSGYDWFYPYYRDRGLCLAVGMTAEEMLLAAVGAEADPGSGGRQMPSHWASAASEPGDPVVANGIAVPAGRRAAPRLDAISPVIRKPPKSRSWRSGDKDYRAYKNVVFHADEVVYCSLGDGTTSEGEFWEAMNSASNLKLPVLFVVQDNGYAISVPVEVNTAGGNISKLVANFPNFFFAEIDGTDAIECYKTMQEAVAYCRAGHGPAFVHGHVTRPYSHSLSDDERFYRSEAEREADAMRDPLPKLQMRILREGILDEAGITRLEQAVDEEIRSLD